MKPGPIEASELDYLVCYNILNNNFTEYLDNIVSHFNQEKETAKKIAIERLCPEARMVFNLLFFDKDNELEKFKTRFYKTEITKNKIILWLKMKGTSPKRIKLVFKELRELINYF